MTDHNLSAGHATHVDQHGKAAHMSQAALARFSPDVLARAQAVKVVFFDVDGVLTDDSGVALQPQTLDQIGQDVNALYAELSAHELAAGSALARRLFS